MHYDEQYEEAEKEEREFEMRKAAAAKVTAGELADGFIGQLIDKGVTYAEAIEIIALCRHTLERSRIVGRDSVEKLAYSILR